MIFASAFLFLFCVWLLPWWGMLTIAIVFGAWARGGIKAAFQCGLAAALVYFAAAFYNDGRALGIISQRLDVLFSSPSPYILYGVTGLLAFVSAFLGFQCGSSLANMVGFDGK